MWTHKSGSVRGAAHESGPYSTRGSRGRRSKVLANPTPGTQRTRYRAATPARGCAKGRIRVDAAGAGQARASALAAVVRHFLVPAVAARYWLHCLPGVGFASTCDLRARDPRLTSYCRCRGRTPPLTVAPLKLVRIPGGRGWDRESLLPVGESAEGRLRGGRYLSLVMFVTCAEVP